MITSGLTMMVVGSFVLGMFVGYRLATFILRGSRARRGWKRPL